MQSRVRAIDVNRRARLVLFALSILAMLAPAAAVVLHMPTFGDHPFPYGDAINRAAPFERHVTNMVSAVNFDYRGFDTLGEEFMLVAAVTGVVVLLRGNRGERLDAAPGLVEGRPIAPRTDAVRLISRWFACIIVLFGVYVALHAMTTPGGGFQGGVIIASGALLLYLGEGYRAWRRGIPSLAADATEGAGAFLYTSSGCIALCEGLPYLGNVLPIGKLHDVFSGGLMPVVNAGVTCAVAGGFTVLFIEFLEETRAMKSTE
jgi:multicomponent Na+:H+ antiporter subunit B